MHCRRTSSENRKNYDSIESVEAGGSHVQLHLVAYVPNKPRYLLFSFKSYGNRNRSFQSGWFYRYPWLHYNESMDAVFCHTRIRAVVRNMTTSEMQKAQTVFTRDGYRNWKSENKKGLKLVLHTKQEAVAT